MKFVLLFAFFAAVSAVPYGYHRSPPYAPETSHLNQYDPFAEDVFDTRRFWAHVANEMRQIDEMLATFSQHFPSMVSQAVVENNEYKITIPLSGFEEKDIVVKAKEGFLMVQATHTLPQGGERMYLDAKTIPNNVNVTGTWTFEQGVLKITFPLKNDVVTEAAFVVTEAPVNREREEMDSGSWEDDKDADIGLRGEDKINELLTNEIPKSRVEATTYAIDLKDEVEFVPVRNYQ